MTEEQQVANEQVAIQELGSPENPGRFRVT